jgi:hypothetical protein
MAAFAAKCKYLNNACVNHAYTLQVMTPNMRDIMFSFDPKKNWEKSLQANIIYLRDFRRDDLDIIVLGSDGKAHSLVLWSETLPDWFPRRSDEVIPMADKCLPIILKRLVYENLIDIIPKNANITEAARDVIHKRKI